MNIYTNSEDESSRTVIAENVEIASGGTEVVTAEGVKTDAEGFLSVNVEKAKVPGSTVNVNYIIIREHREEGAAALEKIEVTAPQKTEYEIGEAFNDDGMAVYAVYSDGTRKILTYGTYTVSGFDSSKAGDKVITVTYTEGDVEKTGEFEITVKEGTDKPVVTPVNKDGLKAVIEAAKAIKPSGYTDDSYQALQQALQNAQTVYDNPDATQKDVDNAASELGAKLRALVVSGGSGSDEENPGGSNPDDGKPGGNNGNNGPATENPDSGKDKAPQTGDVTNITPWAALAIISGTGCAFAALKKKRR